MHIEEYEKLKSKALDFISKATRIDKTSEKQLLLDQAEEIINKLKGVIESKKQIALSKMKIKEFDFQTENIVKAIV